MGKPAYVGVERDSRVTTAEGLFLGFVQLGAFEVDGEGRVWRRVWYATGRRTPVPVNPPARAERVNSAGYLEISFQWSEQLYNVMAHRGVYMVSRRFPLPDDLEVNHCNGKKQDNRPANLEAVTASENMRHSIDMLGNRHGARGDRHRQAKLSWEAVLEIRRAVKERTATQTELCRRFGVSPATMSQAVNGKTWRHVEESL